MSALPKPILAAADYLVIERAAFVNLTSVACEVAVAEIYERVEFPEPAAPASDVPRTAPR